MLLYCFQGLLHTPGPSVEVLPVNFYNRCKVTLSNNWIAQIRKKTKPNG